MYLVPALVVALTVMVRLRLLAVPLERDEGEFAYIGQLLLKGISPFTHAYSMKLPGVSVMYALFISLFGQTSTGIHIGLLLTNLACIGLVFLLGRRLFDPAVAALSAATYAVLSLSGTVYGVHAHATHFVVLFALAGLLLLLRATERSSLAALSASGCCLGLAFTMKQHAVALVAFAFLYLVWRDWSRPETRRFLLKGLPLFLGGIALPYLLILLVMAQAGSLETFWFWTVQYPRAYVSEVPLSDALGNFTFSFRPMLLLLFPFWLLAGAGSLLVLAQEERCRDRKFLLGLLLFSFIAICPGLYFREHYFVMLLPAVALSAGLGAVALGSRLSLGGRSMPMRQAIPALLILAGLLFNAFLEQEYLFKLPPEQVSRLSYADNPFPESVQVARYLEEHTKPEDRIAVLGSEPQIYFYAKRLSATGHIYMYGLMEEQPHALRMQQQMIEEIEKTRPAYVVEVNVRKSWLVGPAENRGPIQQWRERYLKAGYQLVGVTDIVDSFTTRYIWDGAATGYQPVSHSYLNVYKRKDGA